MSANNYYWNGSAWVKVSKAYYWDGSAWKVVNNTYYWNGSAWLEAFTQGFVVSKTFDTGTTLNYNIATVASDAGWDGSAIIIANLTVPSGAYLGSSSTSTYALETESMSANSIVTLTIDSGGYIVGKGGSGGRGAEDYIRTYSSYPAYGEHSEGGPGGPAINAISGITFNLTNNGVIGGGGGGGGGGNGGADWPTNGNFWGGPGGGGAGFGRGGPLTPDVSTAHVVSDAAADGTVSAGSTGLQSTLKAGEANNGSYGGTGGNGGSLGSAGADGGNNGNGAVATYGTGSPGGPAGDAIDGWSNITVTTEGTISGDKNG